jgi:hypothetical protein
MKPKPRSLMPRRVNADLWQGPLYTENDILRIAEKVGLPLIGLNENKEPAVKWLPRELHACAIWYAAHAQADGKDLGRSKANIPRREYIVDLMRAYETAFCRKPATTVGGPFYRFISECLSIIGEHPVSANGLRDLMRAKQPTRKQGDKRERA